MGPKPFRMHRDSHNPNPSPFRKKNSGPLPPNLAVDLTWMASDRSHPEFQALQEQDVAACAPSMPLTEAEIEAALNTNYDRLRGLVCASLARTTRLAPQQLTNPPTAITNDVCMILLRQKQPFRDAEHLMAVASIHCMRLVVDYLRRRSRAKRGSGNRGSPLPNDLASHDGSPASWLLRDGINEALTRLAEDYPRQAQAVMLHAFFGRSVGEIAEPMGVGTATVERELKKAKVYLRTMIFE